MDFSIKTLSGGTKELYVDEKLIASGTQEEILSIMRLMTQHEVLEKSSMIMEWRRRKIKAIVNKGYEKGR